MASNQCKRLECIKELIKTARSNRLSSLRELATEDQDVYNIWDHISQLVEMHMSQRKAVQIPGLGIFTFTSSKLDVGHNKFILIQRPVFILSEKLVRTHKLTQPKHHVPGEIPVIQLNLTSIAYDINVKRDLVEASVKEVINTLSRSIEKLGSYEFAFTTIGNLVISKGAAKMKFLTSFLDKMDSTGSLAKYLSQRPDTSSSILSDNSLILPKIQPGKDVNQKSKTTEFEDIEEEDEEKYGDVDGEGTPKTNTPITKPSTPVTTNREELLSQTLKTEQKTPVIQHLTLTTQEDSAKPITPTVTRRPPQSIKRVFMFRDPRKEGDSTKKLNRVFPTPKSSPMNLAKDLKKLPESELIPPTKQPDDSRCSSCVESMNDFCYLCYQREKRNFPVYYTEQRKKEEQEEDYALQLYTIMKDNELLQREQDTRFKKRKDAQVIASFNLSVGEEMKSKKDEDFGKFHRSFVFPQRPASHHHRLEQEVYQTDLARQVAEKTRRAVTAKQEKDILERQEQLLLAEDLALQRDHYKKSKRLQSDEYRKALDTQIYIKKCLEERYQESHLPASHRFSVPRPNVVLPFQKISDCSDPGSMVANKASDITAAYPDSDVPAFSICDTVGERYKEQRRHAQNLYQQQLMMAEERRKTEKMKSVMRRKEEENMLRRTKADLLQETLSRNQQNLRQRQDLEKTWMAQAAKKKTGEFKENLRTKTPGFLLLEQCDKYKSCDQCTRNFNNRGESNVWSESRYVSGSRLMV